jgi:hypothetical protein
MAAYDLTLFCDYQRNKETILADTGLDGGHGAVIFTRVALIGPQFRHGYL